MQKIVPRFMYPPHPAKTLKITPNQLDHYDKQGKWVAQRKFGGSHAVVWLHRDKVAMWNRNGEPFSSYRLTESMQFLLLHCLERDHDTEYVLDGELLHTKASLPNGKQAVDNCLVLFDILYAGRYLTSLTTMGRLELLHKIAPVQGREPKNRASVVSYDDGSRIWVADTFENDFSYRFWEFYEYDADGNDLYPEIEGLVLKNRAAKNVSLGSRPNDVLWMIRCRKTKEHMYQF